MKEIIIDIFIKLHMLIHIDERYATASTILALTFALTSTSLFPN
jgi:hypothetical protein